MTAYMEIELEFGENDGSGWAPSLQEATFSLFSQLEMYNVFLILEGFKEDRIF